MKVLIVDEGRDRSSVAAARGLAMAGWTVGTGCWTPSLTSKSKASAGWYRVLHTGDGDAAFLASLNEVVVRESFEAAFVTRERAVRAVSEHRDELDFPVGYGPHEGVLLAIDRERLPAVAQRVGSAWRARCGPPRS